VPGVDQIQVRRDLHVRLYEGLGRQRVAVEADPLGDRLQVRAGVAAHPKAEAAQDRVDHPRGGGLAVGAGDQDHRDRPLRVAEDVHQVADPIQRRVELGLRPAGGERRLHLGQAQLGLLAHGRGVYVPGDP
jgi:hypothetical protein